MPPCPVLCISASPCPGKPVSWPESASCCTAAAAAVQQEALSGQETGFPGQGLALIQSTGQGGIQRFDHGVADRHLGVNDGIDNECRVLSGLCERPPRPVAPGRIVGGDVK